MLRLFNVPSVFSISTIRNFLSNVDKFCYLEIIFNFFYIKSFVVKLRSLKLLIVLIRGNQRAIYSILRTHVSGEVMHFQINLRRAIMTY